MKGNYLKQIAIRITCLTFAFLIFSFANAEGFAYAAGNIVDSIKVDKTTPKFGDTLKVSVDLGSGYGSISRVSEIYANYIPANRPNVVYPLSLYYNAKNGLFEGYITGEEIHAYGPGKWLVGSIVIFDKQNKNTAIYNIGQKNTGTKQNLNTGNFTVVSPSGWYSLKGKWYYVVASTGTLKKGWLSDNGKRYFFDTNGVMKTGWLQEDNKWYFLNKDGAMQINWIYEKGKYYYLDSSSGVMKLGWQVVNNKWYYLNSPNGDMKIGWLQVSGKWYFLDNSGEMKKGWYQYGQSWYYFYDSGEMAKNTSINGYWLGDDGAWVH